MVTPRYPRTVPLDLTPLHVEAPTPSGPTDIPRWLTSKSTGIPQASPTRTTMKSYIPTPQSDCHRPKLNDRACLARYIPTPQSDSPRTKYVSDSERACISRASFRTSPPRVWPVMLWVAFQASQSNKPQTIDHLLAVIAESNDDGNLGLWSWNEADEQTLCSRSPRASHRNWFDRYPSSWRKYLRIPDANRWANLEGITRQTPRSRLVRSEYDTTMRVGAIVLWALHSIAGSPDLEALQAFEVFLSKDPSIDGAGFLQCLLKRRAPVHSRYYELDLSLKSVDWRYPRVWLATSNERLLSSALHDPEPASLVHLAEIMHMVCLLNRALPLCFMVGVFIGLLRSFRTHGLPVNQFRTWINALKTWDTMACLVNFREVLRQAFEFFKLTKKENLTKSAISNVFSFDIHSVCAHIAVLLEESEPQEYLKTGDEDSEKLVDLMQDLLDYPLLTTGIRRIIMNILKRATKLGLHPRCFALPDDSKLGSHPVAAGGFGDIYKGLIRGETVSVKVMRVYEEADVQALLKGCYHEALIWRQLSHPNLLPFFGAYYKDSSIKSQLCLVSPWMDNGNITRYLKSNPADVNRLSLIFDVLLGLKHLHGMKVVHGDLKALNILVTRSGRAVMADFGLSSIADSRLILSTSSKSRGTARWQAPELIAGGRNRFASDIYAFSLVCYEIFTGCLPFYETTNDMAVMFQVMKGERPTRSSYIPDDVWNLMETWWDQDPAKRPTATQISFQLQDPPINALATSTTHDWDPWHILRFRASFKEHTLSTPSGIEDWLQWNQRH